MKNIKRKLTLGLVTSSLTMGLAMAGGDYHKKHGDQASMDTTKDSKAQMAKKIRSVSGEITQMKKVRLPGENLANMVVKIKTKKAGKDLIVDIGNAEAFATKNLGQSTRIMAEGRLAKVGNHEILVANHVHIAGEHIEIDRSKEMQRFKEQSAATTEAETPEATTTDSESFSE
ncbi:MAG: hypothetical protein CME62_12185 [Halobacteriovoraceae bacterium]|nr:hypothetical protein [Halobacteriovoraceae bacterium]|tara:strand:+ start:2859 stop:3377 length:519 start_codon:yes stop_codon:yes gene_type:complete